jgi:1,4-dihydroxy-2-naphthoate octaprenyltransferase
VTHDSKVWQGFWRLADPKISITSAVAMLIGGSVAARDAPINWPWFTVMAVALFCVEVAKNAWGEVIDYDSGTDLAVAAEDRTSFSGGKRVMVDSLLSRRQTWAMAGAFGGLALALGALIVFLREPLAFWIGGVGAVLGWSYHGPPLRLAYRGFGELDVVLCYGPLIVLSTYLIQVGSLSWPAVLLSLPLGVLIAAFLWVNEFPDYLADRGAGKRNLVVRLGRGRASRLLPVIYAVAFLLLVLPVGMGWLPAGSLWGLCAVLPALYVCQVVWRSPDAFYRDRPAQPVALVAFVTYAVAVSAGYLASG